MSVPQLVMKALLPLMTHSSPSSSARVRGLPASEPPPGSVRPNAGKRLAATQRGQPFLLLLLGAERVDRHRTEADRRLERDRDARVDPGELLDREAEREEVAAHPGVLLRERQAEQPHLAHLANDVVRELAGAVGVLRLRRDDVTREVLDALAQRLVLVAQPMIHRSIFACDRLTTLW